MQIVEVELDPGETVIAGAGAMNYMDDGIIYGARMAGRILQHARSAGGGSRKGERSVLGSLSDFIDGDRAIVRYYP